MAFAYDRDKAGDLLREPDTLGTVILAITMAAMGNSLFGDPDNGVPAADPLEVYSVIDDEFHAQLPETGENRLNAMMLALETDAFFDDPLAFQSIAHALYSGDLGDMVDGAVEELTVPEMLWAIYEVELNREHDDIPFSPAVQRLIDETIQKEADAREDLEPGDVVPYYEKFLAGMRQDLQQQLAALGVPAEALQQIS